MQDEEDEDHRVDQRQDEQLREDEGDVLGRGERVQVRYEFDNLLSFNTAYSHTKDAMKNLACARDKLESEFGKYIPINIMLKGRQIRVGNLREPEIYVKKGATLRLTSDGRVLGDSHIVPIDDEHFFEQVHENDIIILDYGQVALKIDYREDSEQ